MSDPVIHVIPEQYYGGASPLPVVHKEAPSTPGVTPALPSRKIPTHRILIVAVGVLFVLVVGGASFYFTRGLRQKPAPPVVPVVETPPEGTPAPTPEPPPQAAPVVVPPPAPVPEAAPDLTKDTDNDGLSDAEEQLYHTDSTKPDTDNDGFLDGHEVVNLYNPSGTAPEKLEAAGLVKRVTQPGYELLIPSAWNATPSQGGTLAITTAAGQPVFQVVFAVRPVSLSLSAWYERAHPGTPPPTDAWTSNKAGLTGVILPDHLSAYLTGERGAIVGVTVVPEQTAFKTTFSMLLNSVKLL